MPVYYKETQPRGGTDTGRPLFLQSINTNSHEKKNKNQICSHLHKGGGCENCQSEGVCTSAQWQTRKGSGLLSEVLRVPRIVEH